MINYHPVCGEETMYSVDQDRKSIRDFPSQPSYKNGVAKGIYKDMIFFLLLL